jgi:hypothetical protein
MACVNQSDISRLFFLDLRSILRNSITLVGIKEILNIVLSLGHDVRFLCYTYIFFQLINKS